MVLGVGRNFTTQQLTESILGQHLALSVAAHLARTQLLRDPLDVYDGQHLSEMVDLVANALAKVAPLHIQDASTGAVRELTPAELEGATVRRGATVLALKDGRTLSSVSMKRGDLRQAIATLKAVDIPELRSQPLVASVAELESLLRLPLVAQDVAKAESIAVAIARNAAGPVAKLAMQLIAAVHETRGGAESGPRRIAMALSRLRAALHEPEPKD